MRASLRCIVPALVAALLSACGGGGGGGGEPAPVDPRLLDGTAYSTESGASLGAPDERAAVTTHSVTIAGAAIPYTATAGHLTAIAPNGGAAEASMFYVAYTVP